MGFSLTKTIQLYRGFPEYGSSVNIYIYIYIMYIYIYICMVNGIVWDSIDTVNNGQSSINGIMGC